MAVLFMPDEPNFVRVGDRMIAAWRVNSRPDKSKPICADAHDLVWLDADEQPATPGDGVTLRCRRCTIDCT